MCIASLLQVNNKIILTHNRDENINRHFSKSIITRNLKQESVSYLEDELTSGTWIMNSEKYAACILNGGKEQFDRKIKFPKSRASLLFQLNSAISLEDFIDKNFVGYAPFTIICFDKKKNQAYSLFWNSVEFTFNSIPLQNPFVHLSSTLYCPNKKNKVIHDFNQYIFNKNEEVKNWHQKHKMQLNDVDSEIMTVCIAQIVIDLSNKTENFDLEVY